MGRDKIEVRGSTALICSIASFQDHVSALFLRELGAAPEFEDRTGRTVLMAAVSADNLSIIRELIHAKVSPSRLLPCHLISDYYHIWTSSSSRSLSNRFPNSHSRTGFERGFLPRVD